MQGLDHAFAALSDPTRRAILTRLTGGEATVMELAEPFAMSQPAISRHLRLLEEAGFITRRIDGARRPCQLAPGGIAEIDRWLSLLREALEANYGRLDKLLAAQNKPGKARRGKSKRGKLKR